MLKNFAIFAAVLAVTTMVALAFISARYIDKEEILRVETQMKKLQQQKSALETHIEELDQNLAELNQTIQSKNAEIDANKSAIAQLEQERVDKQLTVRHLSTEDELENSFAQTYPQVVDAKNFGIVQMSIDDELNLKLPYYVIPAWFTETFVIEHNTMLTYKAEIETYKANEELYGSVLELKDKVLKLVTEKTIAYQTGYAEAYQKYELLNQEYIILLKQPPIVEIKPPSFWPTMGGTLLGVALGFGI